MRTTVSQIALIGYSGHAWVVFDIFFSQGLVVSAYTEKKEKPENPFMLTYLGDEVNIEILQKLKMYQYFVALGNNHLRRKISEYLIPHLGSPENAMHKTAILSRSMNCGTGVMCAPRCVINAKAELGDGVICNTGSIIEHECVVGNYTHVGPGAVLCGNVHVGDNSLIGAGAVVLPGVSIGMNVVVGAGAVVLKDVDDNTRIAGNPGRRIK